MSSTRVPDRCTVAVVGAGPAGATAALLFARLGLDVLLLDRCAFPRAKACGDCLSPEANRVLHRLGLLDAVLLAQPARIAGWRIVAPGGCDVEGRFAGIPGTDRGVHHSLAMARERLDAVLVEEAVRAGARFVTGAHVTGVAPGGSGARLSGTTPDGNRFELRAPLVVGADGLRSVIARRLGLVRRPPRVRKISLTAHVTHVRGGSDLGELHLGDGLCAGIAPVAAPVDAAEAPWNLTLVADADRFAARIAAGPEAFFRGALRGFPALADRIAGAQPLARATDGGILLLRSGSFDVPTRARVAPGIALVGDAAGYFDPFTGQGIHQALRDAELLVEATATALARGSSPGLDRYAKARDRRVRGTRIVQCIIDAILRRPWSADAAIARLRERPAALAALLAVTGDIAPPASLLWPRTLIAVVAGA